MPSGISKKVRMRIEEVAHLLHIHGCITTRAVMELGFSHTQATVALKHLVATGRAVRLKIGGIALWCCSMKSALRHVDELRRALHALICSARVKYVSPSDALELIARSEEASRLFSRYINLRPRDATSLKFLNGLLASMYGEAVFRIRRGTMPLYFADCRSKSSHR